MRFSFERRIRKGQAHGNLGPATWDFFYGGTDGKRWGLSVRCGNRLVTVARRSRPVRFSRI